MERQENALLNPIIVSPSDNEHYQILASQSFESLDKPTEGAVHSGWVSVTPDKKVVHHAQPETISKSSDKITKTLESLKPSSETEELPDEIRVEDEPSPPAPVTNPEPSTNLHETLSGELEEPEEPIKLEEPEELPVEKEVILTPIEPVSERPSDSERLIRNTPNPSKGIILNGQSNTPKAPSHLLKKQDDWSAPEENRDQKGRLVVKISDGKVVKKE
jgi:hypothetical protein